MPSFPYVKKGDAFQPNLELDNAVRRKVNAQNGFVAGKFSSKGSYGRISVCNVTSEVIEAGTAVSFPAAADATNGVIPCEKAKSASAQFGVITSDIAPDSIGSCVVSGPVTVEISGTGDFAAPADGGKMVAGSSGAPILFRFDDTAIINLGGGSGSGYDGPFAASFYEVESVIYIHVNEGYAQINLLGLNIPPFDISFVQDANSKYIGFELSIDSAKGKLSYTFMVWDERPLPDIGKTYLVVARIDADKKITQLQYGDFNGTIWGDCAFPSGEYHDI